MREGSGNTIKVCARERQGSFTDEEKTEDGALIGPLHTGDKRKPALVRESQPDRAAGNAILGHLWDEEPLGVGADLRTHQR